MTKAELIAEPGSYEIVMTRVFNAPRELVFNTFVDVNHVAKWWGQSSAVTAVECLQPAKGGQWRFVQTTPEGEQYAFSGVFHTVTAPERIVQTFEFEGMPGHVLMETITFEALADGKTKIVDSSVFQSVQDRDGMLMSGMEGGANESFDRLDALLASL